MNVLLFEPAEWDRPLDPHDDRSRHLRDILKPAPGDAIRVALLDAGQGTAVFQGWDGAVPRLALPPVSALEPAPELLPLHVVLGHPRPPVFQRLLKDLNSLGTRQILAVRAELTEQSYLSSSVWKDEAWRGYLVQGAQQGGLARLSRLDKAWNLGQALEQLPAGGTRICLDLEPDCGLLLDWCAAFDPGQPEGLPLVLALGPERGWTDRERRLMRQAGFVTMSLGPSILRTEMACVLACGLAGMALGRALPRAAGQGRGGSHGA